MKYFKRILAAPFIFVIALIHALFHTTKRTWQFIKYGGEITNYVKEDKKTIQDIYEILKENYERKRNN